VAAGTILLNILLIVVLTRIWPNLLFVKTVSATILVISPLVYRTYVKKHFQLDRSIPPDDNALKQRWSGFGHTLAYFANTNISVLALTLFSSLSTISVYSIYLMITNSLRNFSVAIATALMPSLGDVLAGGDKEKSRKAFDVYEFGMSFFTTLLFSCGIALIMPFVRIYTVGFTDADYIQPAFGILLMLAEMVYCLREPYTNVGFAAGYFKPTAKFAYWEVGIHGVLALLLVPKFGLMGVAIAFLVALVYRMAAQVIYLRHNILERPLRLFVKNIVVFGLAGGLVVLLATLLLPLNTIGGYLSWFIYGAVTFILALIILLGVSVIAYRKELMALVNSKLRKKPVDSSICEDKNN
jgi:O-antigen/teichoic acid export membrane protein